MPVRRLTMRARGPCLTAVTLAVVLVGSLTAASGAWAYVPSVPKQPYYADSLTHTYSLSSSSLTSTQRSAATAAMNYLGSSTNMTTQAVAQTATTDVVINGSWPSTAPYNSYYAWTTCSKALNSSYCDRFRIAVNRNKSHSNWRSLFCHEIGHTLGFQNPGGKNSDATSEEKTCMRSSPDVIVYAAEDRAWINWWY